MTFLIIILPKRKEPMRLPLTHWASVRCTQINRLYIVWYERHIQLTYVNARYFPRQAAQWGHDTTSYHKPRERLRYTGRARRTGDSLGAPRP